MAQQTRSYRLFVGIDVAARTFTFATMSIGTTPSHAQTIAQSVSGFAELERHLLLLEPDPSTILVVLEATGTYWMRLALALVDARSAVSVVNPQQAHDFATSLLKRSKTDSIDAQTLAELAARMEPQPWTPPPHVATELQQRLVHRDALIDARTQFRNQLHALEHQPLVVNAVQKRLEELISTLSSQIAEVEKEIATALEQDQAWAIAARYLATIKGFGGLTIAWLLTATSNFTLTTTPQAAANYVGLVPQLRESGTSVRGRASIDHSGHARLRKALYMATLSAIQHNPVIKAFYERLVAKGKPKKVAICAAARKLLCIAWAVATKKQAFDPSYVERRTARAA